MKENPSHQSAPDSEEGALAPDKVARLMEEEGRGRRRSLLALFIGMSLLVYCWIALSLWFLIVNTDLRTAVPAGLAIGGVGSFFMVIPVGLLFTAGYYIGRAWAGFSRRWMVGWAFALVPGIWLVGSALHHRLDSGILFEDALGCELPSGAWDVSHRYENCFIEQHGEIQFFAEREDLVKLMKELGLDPQPELGFQVFDSIPWLDWDHASFKVDWSTGGVVVEFFEV